MRPVGVGKERRDLAPADWVVPKIQVSEHRVVVDRPVLPKIQFGLLCRDLMPLVHKYIEVF